MHLIMRLIGVLLLAVVFVIAVFSVFAGGFYASMLFAYLVSDTSGLVSFAAGVFSGMGIALAWIIGFNSFWYGDRQ